MGSTGETRGWRGEEEERGMWREERRERLLVHSRTLRRCLHSPVDKETKKLANVGNRCLSCQWKKKTNGEKKKKRRESARLVILITRQNTYLTSWPQPSHMMGFGNEPITLTDADEVEPKPLALVWPLSCASHKENHSTVLLSNEK